MIIVEQTAKGWTVTIEGDDVLAEFHANTASVRRAVALVAVTQASQLGCPVVVGASSGNALSMKHHIGMADGLLGECTTILSVDDWLAAKVASDLEAASRC